MNSTTSLILDIFQDFRMPALENDRYDAEGKAILGGKIDEFVEAGKTIDFVMLGFPMKSPNNRDKVIGKAPDMAEKVTIDNFAYFNRRVKEVYKPGVNIAVVSDGYAFNDLMEVSETTVHDYVDGSIQMSHGGGTVSWYDLTDFYSQSMRINRMREKLMSQWGITDEELERRIMFDPDVNTLYKGMIRFMNLDIAIREFASGSQLQKAAKKLARQMMLRNEAYSALVQSEFGATHIRLSMHHSINVKKFSFQLIPSRKAWTSPWHSALLMEEDGTMATIHKKDAVAAGHELVSVGGKPFYYAAR